MQDNARTTEFRHRITVGNEQLSYSETTIVEIYEKFFEHTDKNELVRQAKLDASYRVKVPVG